MRAQLLAFFAVVTIVFAFSAPASAQCNGRYDSKIFPSTKVTSDIKYGQNTLYDGSNQSLFLDVYEPENDSSNVARALIVLAHGGSFIGGSKLETPLVEVAQRWAQRGYVVASISYRLMPVLFSGDTTETIKQVVRAVQDGKAAIRWFKQDVDTGSNQFRIDTNQVFIGGNSAGSILALHLAYLNDTINVEPHIKNLANQLGGLEGNSGNPGYNSAVNGVINLWGALKNPSYMESGDVPIVSVHGDADVTVPHNSGKVYGIPTQITVYGSTILHQRADSLGINNAYHLFAGGGHSSFSSSAAHMDTTETHVADFLATLVNCNTLISSVKAQPDARSFKVYPVPAQDQVVIELPQAVKTVKLIDLAGRTIAEYNAEGKRELMIDRGATPAGVYYLSAQPAATSNVTYHGKVVFW